MRKQQAQSRCACETAQPVSLYKLTFVHRYVLEDVESNNERYLLDAHIATGPLVAELLDQSA
jgi:hypothetical protein